MRLLSPLLVFLAGAASAQHAQRLVEFIDVQERARYVEISMQFSCTLRYVSHTPAAEGMQLRIRLRPGSDCGRAASFAGDEFLPLSGTGRIVSAATLTEDIPGEFALTLAWVQAGSSIVAQGSRADGLRIRLMREPRERGRVFVGERAGASTRFAVNLESRHEPFAPAEIARAGERLGQPVFVSAIVVGADTWHRLRVGPFERRELADEVLRSAAKFYPQAWLAIGDDQPTSAAFESSGAPEELPAVERAGADPALEATTRNELLQSARAAMRARDYGEVVKLLTRLQRQPEYPQRAQVQELLGLARERAGQMAHAQAEHEEYLRRYPDGEAAERVRTRLQTLRAAAAPGARATPGVRDERGWRIDGLAAQTYRRDASVIDSAGTTTSETSHSALYSDADLSVRRRGERRDFSARVSAGYAKDLLPQGNGDEVRVSAAWIEVADRALGLAGRLGRQPRGSAGVLGTFDGAAVQYELRPSWSIDTALGMPVESSHDPAQTDRQFASVALNYAPGGASWTAAAFLAEQRFGSLVDRRAAGVEASYFHPARTLLALLDYDVQFASVNTALLVGTLHLPQRFLLTFDLQRRNSPVLTARNALVGQPVDSLAGLRSLFGDEEIEALARDRTAVLSSYAVSLSRPVGERLQFSADIVASQLGSTPASAGVPAQPSGGLDLSYQGQVFGTSVFRSGDFHAFALRYDDRSTARVSSAGITSRLPLFGGWRVGPRLRAEQHRLPDGSTRELFVPSLRIDYARGRVFFELEAGRELGRADLSGADEDSSRTFLSVGYRVGF